VLTVLFLLAIGLPVLSSATLLRDPPSSRSLGEGISELHGPRWVSRRNGHRVWPREPDEVLRSTESVP
jgi:hypothetical protein